METLLFKVGSLASYKDALKVWCRRNEIKVSFLVNMTLSKSKAIYSKLLKTYSKGFGKSRIRWLQNQLKLYHFSLLAISTLYETKICLFGKEQWSAIRQAFPNKDQTVLQYETMNFITSKDTLKKKWETEEDESLTEIVRNKFEDQLKWNEIAVDLFMQSNKKFFRTSKQCRQRWLNHLDSAIKHEKWTQAQDQKLINCVLEEGKKWSQIMRSFQNQRTEHMIKNRFISLILKYKKGYPMIQDEDEIVKEIACQMGLSSRSEQHQNERMKMQKKLRPKQKSLEQESDQKSKISEQQEHHKDKELTHLHHQQHIQLSQNPDQQNIVNLDENCYQAVYDNFQYRIPTPTYFTTMPYMDYNAIANNMAYYQFYMNYLQQTEYPN